MEDLQVELLLLHSCLGVCKLNHLLRTIPPGSVDSELLRFDDNLQCALLSICNTSISDQSWLQATLPCSLGGLDLYIKLLVLLQQPFWVAVLALLFFVSSFCLPFQEVLFLRLLFHLSTLLSGTPIPEVPASRLSEAQRIFQFQLDICQFNSLLSSCSLHDQARIHAISSHTCASAWLRAIPSVSLGLAMSGQEFVCSL